jgi:hypothetical protein
MCLCGVRKERNMIWDSLVRIRIPRIRTTDLRIRIPLFSSVADKMPTKKKFSKSFVAHYFFKVHFYQSSKIKSVERNHKKYKSRFFLLICLLVEESGSGSRPLSVQIMTDPGGPKTSATLLETSEYMFTLRKDHISRDK